MIRAERVLLVTAIVLVATLFGGRQVIQAGQSQGRSASTETNPFNGLRQRALTVDAKMIGISPGKGQIWCAIVDLGMDTGTATIVCFTDGTTSLYLAASSVVDNTKPYAKSPGRFSLPPAPTPLVLRPLRSTRCPPWDT